MKASDKLIARARKIHQQEGEVEIDDNAEESRPDGDEGGSYVQAWVWVPDEEEEG